MTHIEVWELIGQALKDKYPFGLDHRSDRAFFKEHPKDEPKVRQMVKEGYLLLKRGGRKGRMRLECGERPPPDMVVPEPVARKVYPPLRTEVLPFKIEQIMQFIQEGTLCYEDLDAIMRENNEPNCLCRLRVGVARKDGRTGICLKELSERIETEQWVMRMWEKGSRPIPRSKTELLKKLFKVSEAELYAPMSPAERSAYEFEARKLDSSTRKEENDTPSEALESQSAYIRRIRREETLALFDALAKETGFMDAEVFRKARGMTRVNFKKHMGAAKELEIKSGKIYRTVKSAPAPEKTTGEIGRTELIAAYLELVKDGTNPRTGVLAGKLGLNSAGILHLLGKNTDFKEVNYRVVWNERPDEEFLD